MFDLTGRNISQSYQEVLHIADGRVYDGTGSLAIPIYTGSFVGDGSLITGIPGVDLSSLNQFTSSYFIDSSSFSSSISNLETWSSSLNNTIDTGSFATTGSNTFTDNQNIIGDVTSSNSLISGSLEIGIGQSSTIFNSFKTQINNQTNSVYSLDSNEYNAMFVEYTLQSASNARAGNIMGMWLGSDTNYTETNINDFGNTSDVSFMIINSGSRLVLSASVSSGIWDFKANVRGM
jgi:hypothetical protein